LGKYRDMEQHRKRRRGNRQEASIITLINLFNSCSDKNTEVELEREKCIEKWGFSTASLSSQSRKL